MYLLVFDSARSSRGTVIDHYIRRLCQFSGRWQGSTSECGVCGYGVTLPAPLDTGLRRYDGNAGFLLAPYRDNGGSLVVRCRPKSNGGRPRVGLPVGGIPVSIAGQAPGETVGSETPTPAPHSSPRQRFQIWGAVARRDYVSVRTGVATAQFHLHDWLLTVGLGFFWQRRGFYVAWRLLNG